MIDFGITKSGQSVKKYTITNGTIEADIIDYGATVTAIRVPDKTGRLLDVVLGYEKLQDYENLPGFLGAAIGRVGNRIGGAKFDLDGITYNVTANDNGNSLHGGGCFEKVVFELRESGKDFIVLRYISPDGENGYPGTLTTDIKYTVTLDNALQLEYTAVSDKTTVVSLTNHSYFNLAGEKTCENSIYDQYLKVDADYFLETDEKLIPTGNKLKTENQFDFKAFKKIGQDIGKDCRPLQLAGGYDHNFCLNNNGKFMPVAAAYSEKSGIQMEVLTDLPGVQVYSGNFLESKNIFPRRSAFCLETQSFPDAVNHKEFGSIRLCKGEQYYTKTAYRFSIR